MKVSEKKRSMSIHLLWVVLLMGIALLGYLLFWNPMPEFTRTYRLSNDLQIRSHEGRSFVYNTRMQQVMLRDLESWRKDDQDERAHQPIWCRVGNYRGFVDRQTGQVLVKPDRYTKAWFYSEGLAAVEEHGVIKFIDLQGKEVIDTGVPYDPTINSYQFHNGYCIVSDASGKRGLIDHDGRWALPAAYDRMVYENDSCWLVTNDGRQGVINARLREVLPCQYQHIEPAQTCGLTVTHDDNSMSQYDYDGRLVNSHVYVSVELLRYEMLQPAEQYEETYAVAPCRVYHAANESVGLLGTDMQPLTPPSYICIAALDANHYLATMNNGNAVVLDGKGQMLRSQSVASTSAPQ